MALLDRGEIMIAAIYRFKLKPHQEMIFQKHWHTVAEYFKEKRGAIGSCLHKGENNLWVAYSRWPNRAVRDASWPGDDAPSAELPRSVRDAIHNIQAIKKENVDLESFEDIILDVVEDML